MGTNLSHSDPPLRRIFTGSDVISSVKVCSRWRRNPAQYGRKMREDLLGIRLRNETKKKLPRKTFAVIIADFRASDGG